MSWLTRSEPEHKARPPDIWPGQTNGKENHQQGTLHQWFLVFLAAVFLHKTLGQLHRGQD